MTIKKSVCVYDRGSFPQGKKFKKFPPQNIPDYISLFSQVSRSTSIKKEAKTKTNL